MFSRARTQTGQGLRRFRADKAGAVALIFGLTLIPMLGFVGGAIDYVNAHRYRTKLQNALDAATLAAGREVDMGAEQSAAQQIGMDTLKANLGPNFPAGYSASFNINGTAVTGNATLNVDTYLLGVVGFDQIPVGTTSRVNVSNGTIEVMMVLDNSGSMRGSRLSALKDAAKSLTQNLFQNQRATRGVSMGVVPFAATVNVGTQYANASWMDRNGDSSIHDENLHPKKGHPDFKTRFDVFNTMIGTSWRGCVEVRPAPHDVTDSAPTGGDSLFVPYFAPDEPDRGYPNSYLNDDGGSCGRPPSGETEEQAQEKTCKYERAFVRPWEPGPNYYCDSEPVTPLTDVQGQVISAINNMRADGNTNIHEGVMWGWRLLSPDEPFTEGRSYTETSNRKFMIVMTDGANTYGGRSNQNMSNHSAYGYSKHGRLRSPTTSSSRLVSAMNDKTLASCTNAKAADITIYTVAFDVDDADTVAMLRQCASGSSRAFTINDSGALIAVFEAIAKEINRLRITS